MYSQTTLVPYIQYKQITSITLDSTELAYAADFVTTVDSFEKKLISEDQMILKVSHPVCVQIIPILYKNCLGYWKDILVINKFPQAYMYYDQRLSTDRSLYDAYGTMLKKMRFNIQHIPIHIRQELNRYVFNAPSYDCAITYLNDDDNKRYSGALYAYKSQQEMYYNIIPASSAVDD